MAITERMRVGRMEAFYEDILGELGFRVVWLIEHEYSVSVDVYEITGLDEQNSPMFGDIGTGETPETYVNGFLKWDACCHFYLGEADNAGYIHMCGPESFKKHVGLFDYLLRRGPELIQASDADMWAA